MCARGRFNNDLPSIAGGSAFMKGGSGRRKSEKIVRFECLMDFLNFVYGDSLGFIGKAKFGEISKGGELAFLAVGKQDLIERRIVAGYGELDGRVFGLISLDKDMGVGVMTTADSPDDLSEKMEGAFGGGEVGEMKATVGLDDADSDEMREVQAFGESLSADEEVNFAGFDGGVKRGEIVGFSVVGIKTGDFGLRKEVF